MIGRASHFSSLCGGLFGLCFGVRPRVSQVSRSFAVVIQTLPDEIKDAICIFYLVLRGLDTVEDDMAIPNEKKLPMLESFHLHLQQPGWNVDGTPGHAQAASISRVCPSYGRAKHAGWHQLGGKFTVFDETCVRVCVFRHWVRR